MLKTIGRSARLLVLGGGVACVPAASAFTQVPAADTPAGTYQVSICEGVCAADGANLLVTGIMVLTPQTFTLARLSEAGQRHLRQSDPWMLVALRELDREPNACFALETYPAAASSFASSMPTSITNWRSSEHRFAVLLWVSPDAGYEAVLRPDGPDLRGSGFVWGMGGRYREINEMVTATYVGPPDLDRCLRVIETEAARGVTRN
ncbi:MAG TPA: hypothetical protein VLK84_02150 [Longimicrobium sp.]|nr:hypothetical protein [Longimicrobium sp.]